MFNVDRLVPTLGNWTLMDSDLFEGCVLRYLLAPSARLEALTAAVWAPSSAPPGGAEGNASAAAALRASCGFAGVGALRRNFSDYGALTTAYLSLSLGLPLSFSLRILLFPSPRLQPFARLSRRSRVSPWMRGSASHGTGKKMAVTSAWRGWHTTAAGHPGIPSIVPLGLRTS